MTIFSEARVTTNRTRHEEMKNYLKQYLILNRKINRQLEEIEALREKASRARNAFSDMPKDPSRNKDHVDIIIKILEIEEYLKQEIEKSIEVRQDIYDFICLLDNETIKSVMLYHYINGLTWEKTAAKMGYNWRWVHKLHAKALDQLSKIGHCKTVL